MIDFEQFVKEEQGSLRRFLLSLCAGNEALADDLAQESFIKAYLSLPGFSSKSKLSTWLFSIAYNHFIDYTRKAKIPTESIDETHCHTIPDSKKSDSQFEYEPLYRALEKLSPMEQSVVLLFYMEDKSIKEIAAITSLKMGTIKSHLSRAREHLRHYLNQPL